MSRHRRQRNKRWQATRGRADHTLVEYGQRVFDQHGKISTALPPLEKLLVVEWVRRTQYEYSERVRRLRLRQGQARVVEAAKSGLMVMYPKGHRYEPDPAKRGPSKGNWRKVTP